MSLPHLPYHWRERMCQMLLIPLAHQNMRYLDAWQKAEGGTAGNNPLNTTYDLPGSTDYNTVGVKNYMSAIEGICAQAITLARNSAYLGLWKDMQAGTYSAEDIVNRNRPAISTWGTDPDLILKVLGTLL